MDRGIDNLHFGDSRASIGDWQGAIDAWEQAARHDPRVLHPVQQRLTWLLDQTQPKRNRALPSRIALYAIFVIAALLAVGLVAVAGDPGTPAATRWAVAAWIMIGVSSIAALLAARDPVTPSLERQVREARQAVEKLTAAHGIEEIAP